MTARKVAKLKLVSEPTTPATSNGSYVRITSVQKTAIALKLYAMDEILIAKVLRDIVAPLPARAGQMIAWHPLGGNFAMTVLSSDGNTILRERGQNANDKLGELLDSLVACGAIAPFTLDAQVAAKTDRASWIF